MTGSLSNDDILQSTEDAYRAVHDSLPNLLGTASPEERMKLIELRDALRDTFWAVRARKLEDFGKVVADLHAQLQEATKKVKAELAAMTDVVAAIRLVTQVVTLAASIASLAAAA